MNLSFTCGHEKIEMEVVFRKRKTMEIQVRPPGVVRVLVPAGTPKGIILDRVKSKERWISQKINQLRVAGQIPANKELLSGETLSYLGRKYPLQVHVEYNLKKPLVKLYRGKITVIVPDQKDETVRAALRQWYVDRAERKIRERVEYYSRELKKTPAQIKIKDQKRRWGSCTGNGKVLFNWRCIMAPLTVLDYVVVHEMCHLYHMNHSREFWLLVASVLPDYKERREWLKTNGIMLDF